jgi:hypothetical protein
MGQVKGNPTASYQNQAYEALRPNDRTNRNLGMAPVMINHNTTLTAVIDATFATDAQNPVKPIYAADDATVAVSAAINGKVFIATKASATQTFTLPAASTAGLEYTFICGNAGGELKILGIAGNTINLKTAAAGTVLSIAADTGIKNTAATNIVGDTITLVSDGITSWYAVSQNGIFASN